jgi:hypothetical protein
MITTSLNMNRILILFAHPSLGRSEVNVELLRASRLHEAISVVDLYGEYPDYHIDIDREHVRDWERVLEALVHDSIDLEAASALPTLNGALDRLLARRASKRVSDGARR